MRFVRVSVLACVLLPLLPFASAHARPRAPALAPECNVSMSCDTRWTEDARPSRSERKALRRSASRQRSAPHEALAYAPPTAPVEREAPAPTGRSVSVGGIVPALAAKVAQIQSSCPGAHVISGLRHTRIRGSGRMSLHATGEAVDMRGNPSCVYAQLRDWPGGYSTDYGRVQHIHISLAANGREAGLRFAHGGGRHHHHRHRRLASR
jgi:hypothetical protein